MGMLFFCELYVIRDELALQRDKPDQYLYIPATSPPDFGFP